MLIHFDAVSAAQLGDIRPGSQQHFYTLAETRTYHIEARLSPDQYAALAERQNLPEEEHWYALEVSAAGLWPLTFFDADTEEELGFANAVVEQLGDGEQSLIRECVVLPPAAAAPEAIADLFTWETPAPTFVSVIDAISCSLIHPRRWCLSTAGARPAPSWLPAAISHGLPVYCGFDADCTGDDMADAMIKRYPAIKRLRPPAHDWNDSLPPLS